MSFSPRCTRSIPEGRHAAFTPRRKHNEGTHLREKSKKTNSEYVSRHAAPDKSGGVKRAARSKRESARDDEARLPKMQTAEIQEPDDAAREEEAAKRAAARRDRGRRVKIALTIVICIVLLLAGAATVGGYMVTSGTANLPNVYVGGVYVGGMDKAASAAALEASGWDEQAAVALKVRLMDKVTFKIGQYASGAKHTIDEACEAAYAYGHGDNWYLNLAEYLKSLVFPVEINDGSISYNRDYIRRQALMGIDKLNDALGSGDYEIDKEKSVLRMVKGAGQLSFDTEDMVDEIIGALASGQTRLSYDRLAKEPDMPDFQAIHDKLAAEPKDAYFTDDNTFTVVDDVEGCEFSVDDAKSIWTAADNAAVVEIPITLTYPEVTGDYLRGLLFRDKLGGMTTYFKNSNDNRISNIKLASSKINGIILYPGDVFSYNETLGQRTEGAGFKMAGAYSNGEVVEELGGGICQVSSTLYSAMLYSYRVNTVTRSPHYFPVDYLEKGYDATVSWPSPDFKFRNDSDYPIRIAAYCDEYERSLTVEIWGTNLDGTYIELRKDTYSYNNDRYPWIMEGYGVQMHRLVFDANGMQIDQIDEVYDVYHTHEATDQIKALDAAAAAQTAADGFGSFQVG